MDAVKLLNHGHIRLVSYMQPAEPIDGWTGDLEVVRNARTSYDAAWRAGEDAGKDAKLLNYLIENAHTSPLEAMTFTFEVKLPIFVVRQWQRHRTWAFSEVSGRYAELPEEYYVPEISQITAQSKANKQQRTDEVLSNADAIQAKILDSCYASFQVYHELLADGCPRELARTVLPLATYTHMFATVNLLNLLKFIKLRSHSHAQHEIRVYSDTALDLIEPIVPVIVGAARRHWITGG